jgi:putative FmdB family regulatory protein
MDALMPTYEFQCKECKHEWEDFMSIKAPDPEECPSCKVKGQVLRLISGGSGRGTVELYGHELVDKLKGDAQKLKQDAAKNEKVYANLLGDDHYQALQTRIDTQKKERKEGKVRRR